MRIHKFNIGYSLPILILGIFSFHFSYVKCGSLNFKHLRVEDGLSQSIVFSIYKDQKGFMWFGTGRGLNRYDGYEFEHFMHDVNNPNSLSSNIIHSIIGDKKDNLIIQTENDINYYNRYKENFSVIPLREFFWNFIKDRDNNIWTCSISGIYIFNDRTITFDTVENKDPFIDLYDLTLDKNNNFWLTGNKKVIKYDPDKRKFKIYELKKHYGIEAKNFFIETDSDGKIWICLRNGELLYYNEKSDEFINPGYKNLPNNHVTSFGSGPENSIIIGTDGNGIIHVDTRTHKSTIYNHIPDEESSLSSNTFYSIFSDNKLGILWLGSYMGGIDYYCHYDKGFKFIFHQPYNNKSIINSNVRSLLADNKKNIWIGTRQGISVIDNSGNLISELNQEKLFKAGITNPIITRIWQDASGYIWICSYKGGIILFDPLRNKYAGVSEIYPNISLPPDLGIFDITMDSKSNIWIASEIGTFMFPYKKKGFIFDENFSKKIIEDRAGRIFIATSYTGLLQVDNMLQIAPVSFDSLGNSEKTGRINTLFEDSEGNIWIGMGGSGIIRYNPSKKTAQHFTSENGLSDNNIAAIIEDKNNIIWVTTYSGICRYSKNTGRFKNVFFEKGIKGKEFNPNSIEILPDGTIYAGSINGLLRLNSNTYKENPFLPEVIFTDLYINNEKISVGQSRSPVENSIMFSDRIILKYFQNSLILKFSAPEYYLGEKVKFYYRFGEDYKKWNDLGNARLLNIVDLKPGKYELVMKTTNSDGYSKTEGTKLMIQVNPPPWKTIIAYFFYGILIIGLIALLRHFIKARLKLRYQILLQKAENDKQNEINQSRVKLFTDVSHEIGTSLTLLNVPLETLNNIESDDIKKHYLAIINKNVQRLIRLVKRIIDLRKIETGNMPLLAEKDDIVSFLKNICDIFEAIARKRKISLIFDFPNEKIETWFDKEKIEYVLFSLLSNAFKSESENGKVLISIKKETGLIKGEKKKIVSIMINNKGSLILNGNIKNIYKEENENKSGLGTELSLAKSYVEIHKGEIDFTSDNANGFTFEIKLPYGESFLLSNEKKIKSLDYELKIPIYLEPENEITFNISESEHDAKNKILIIEDNIELQNLLIQHLSGKYDIIEARDGDDGILKAKNFQPDIVISDLKTPNYNGFELCRTIKKDFETGHIPVIILSNNEDIEEKIKGMEAGADVFITKPFSIYFLLSAIKNLIDLRKKLKKKYYIGGGADEDHINIPSIDENFLEKAYAILDNNMDNIQFGIPEFIDQMGISKYMLYSKIKNLTGQTPNDFMIAYKLRKAANILKNKEISDIDLYYRLGFNDVSYFRKCFKKYYGVTPTQFLKSNKFMKKGESE